jgi:hypothetical protein
VSAAQQFVSMLPNDGYRHMRPLTGDLIAGKHRGVSDFGFGLELILDGLERLRRAC